MNDAKMDACIEDCLDCHRTCVETLSYCLQQGGKHAEAEHVTLMLDCAEMCQTAANFMMRMSPLHERTCLTCAEICERCAADCASFDDETMRLCADACASCAESCREMSGTKTMSAGR
jgi:hypothetical protein